MLLLQMCLHPPYCYNLTMLAQFLQFSAVRGGGFQEVGNKKIYGVGPQIQYTDLTLGATTKYPPPPPPKNSFFPFEEKLDQMKHLNILCISWILKHKGVHCVPEIRKNEKKS